MCSQIYDNLEKFINLHVIMKKFLTILLVLLAGCSCAHAQTIRNSSYSTIGYIQRDGTVQDGSYRTIAHIKSDGTVQDGSYRTVAYIKNDGTIQNGSYSTKGHVKSDGTVQDGSYRTIGQASGIKKEWAAWFFFFK